MGGDRTAFLWDVATAKTLRRFDGHTARVNCVTFNAEANVMITGSFDAKVRLWDLRSGAYKPIEEWADAGDSVTGAKVAGCEVFTGYATNSPWDPLWGY